MVRFVAWVFEEARRYAGSCLQHKVKTDMQRVFYVDSVGTDATFIALSRRASSNGKPARA